MKAIWSRSELRQHCVALLRMSKKLLSENGQIAGAALSSQTTIAVFEALGVFTGAETIKLFEWISTWGLTDKQKNKLSKRRNESAKFFEGVEYGSLSAHQRV